MSLIFGILTESSKLCAAADSDEELFWKLLKGQCCSSQMSAFLVTSVHIAHRRNEIVVLLK